MVTQLALLDAFHPHPVAAVTATVPVPAAAVGFADAGEIVGTHGAAAWVTVNVVPPIVSVPVRGVVVVLAATLYVTEPLPLPVAPAVTVIQASLLVAVQPQPLAAVTVTVPVPAADVGLADAGEMVDVQGAAAWLTVNVLAPIVNVPVRGVVAVFAAMLYVTEPLPLPVAPAVTAIHASLLATVHAQPVAAVTVNVPVPAAAVGLADAGDIVGTQGAPAWVTVNVLPPIIIVPERGVVVVFAATPYVTEPLPLPVPPAVIVIHASLLAAVHAQPVAAVTLNVPVPAAAAGLADAGEIVGVQGAPA
jgi:hypothetical protein